MKIAHTNQHPTLLKLLLGVLITTCGFTVAANAQPSFAGKFTLPYEVHWGQAVLPAGEYSIRMNSMSALPEVSSASGSRKVYTLPPVIADGERGGTYLTITTQGNEHTVRSLNLPQLGKVVIFKPLTKSERESLAKAGQINNLPVVSAKK
jgi:hypothetical protein